MPVYHCWHGDGKEFTLTEEGVFVVKDTKGRNWFCLLGNPNDLPPGVEYEEAFGLGKEHRRRS
jgi:hypothetical protein